MLCSAHYIWVILSTCNQYTQLLRYLTFFHAKASNPSVNFIFIAPFVSNSYVRAEHRLPHLALHLLFCPARSRPYGHTDLAAPPYHGSLSCSEAFAHAVPPMPISTLHPVLFHLPLWYRVSLLAKPAAASPSLLVPLSSSEKRAPPLECTL